MKQDGTWAIAKADEHGWMVGLASPKPPLKGAGPTARSESAAPPTGKPPFSTIHYPLCIIP